MDRPTMEWLHNNIHPTDAIGRRVLEVGSYNVNGSVAPHIKKWTTDYVGVDIAPGPGVDRVVNVHDLVKQFGEDQFDLVVSTEMLEHVEDWRNAIRQMTAVLKPGGTLVLTTRAPGFVRHCHPWDFWRFTTTNLRRALWSTFSVEACRYVLGQGVVIKGQKYSHSRARFFAREPRNRLENIHPKPAPAKMITNWKVRYLWAIWAYRGTSSEAKQCCPTVQKSPSMPDGLGGGRQRRPPPNRWPGGSQEGCPL